MLIKGLRINCFPFLYYEVIKLNEAVIFVWDLSDLQSPSAFFYCLVYKCTDLAVCEEYLLELSHLLQSMEVLHRTYSAPSFQTLQVSTSSDLSNAKRKQYNWIKPHQSTKWQFYDRFHVLVPPLSFLSALFLSSSWPFLLNIDYFPWLFFFLSCSQGIYIWQPQEREETSKEMAFQELQQRCQNNAAGIQGDYSYIQAYIWVCARVLLLCCRYPAASLPLVSTPRTPTSPPPRAPMTRSSPSPCTVPLTWPSCRRTSVAWPPTVSYFDWIQRAHIWHKKSHHYLFF